MSEVPFREEPFVGGGGCTTTQPFGQRVFSFTKDLDGGATVANQEKERGEPRRPPALPSAPQ